MAALLLDTHALIWWAAGARTLSAKVRRLMEDDTTIVLVSAASAWEIATKVRLGRLTWNVDESIESYCRGQRFELLPMSFAHCEYAGALAAEHGDPFDRMLVAQSRIEGVPLATNDRALRASFDVEVVW